MRSSLLGDIECPVFTLIVQTLLIGSGINPDDRARGLMLAASVLAEVGGVLGRYDVAAREFVSWVADGMAGDSPRKPAWWVD